MPVLRLTNTLTRTLEDFRPIDQKGKVVTFYSCGPTVYDDAHIGNFRSFLNADVLRRTLELLGYEVRHVMNITDVGHMTDDEDADGGGEDKMAVAGRRIAEAKKSGKLPAGSDIDPSNPFVIAEFYAARFLEDARHLGLKVAIEEAAKPGSMPRPTRYVREMIALVERLVARGHAYVGKDGVVYFDVKSYEKYGALSGNTLDQLREGAGERISAEHQANKKHPADFMLWKPDPSHLMKWDSPWGAGYPGWHLECSAMAAALLGEEIDLHSGGEDNIFPHHECEIAQSCCASGHAFFARYWFHTRHLMVEGMKMSKSKGNFFTARDLFAEGRTPAALRLELIRSHYRINSNFTKQGLADCQTQINRWAKSLETLEAAARGAEADRSKSAGPFERGLADFTEALCDDLNVARAIAAVNVAAGVAAGSDGAGACPVRERAALLSMNSVLGVLDRNVPLASAGDADLAAKVEALLVRRKAAREAKNWPESDKIRDELNALQVAVKDGPTGTTWSKIVK
ncbi:MAG: cysteine--tRNA ligase [Phycisphaerae bacterium]|nr:cysteine--tRNA ligase [Phycisphaerae bacterium]